MNLAIKLVALAMFTLIGMTAFLWVGWPAAAFMALCAGVGLSIISVLSFIKKYLEEAKVEKILYEDSLRTRIETLPQRVEPEGEELYGEVRSQSNHH